LYEKKFEHFDSDDQHVARSSTQATIVARSSVELTIVCRIPRDARGR